MSFTARHYTEVARIIAAERERYNTGRRGMVNAAELATNAIQEDLRRMFAADNPRFDAVRFDMACEPKQEVPK